MRLSSKQIFLSLFLFINNNLSAQDILSKTDFTKNTNSEKNHFHGNINVLFLAGSVKGYNDNGDIEQNDDFQVYPFPVGSLDLKYDVTNITFVSKLSVISGLGFGFNYLLGVCRINLNQNNSKK